MVDSELNNIDWFITRECNQARFCQFCNAPWNKFSKDADKETALRVADRIGELQVETVTLCGGEPTQYPYLPEVIDRLSSQNTNIVLYSNTVSVLDFDWTRVLPRVSVLSLPVDAVSDVGMQFMRGQHQIEGVKRVLGQVKKMEKSPIVKIGTVVTAGNINDLPNIHEFLLEQQIQVWRLYQFSPYGLGLRNQYRYTINDDRFNRAVVSVKNENDKRLANLIISERTRDDIAGGYCRIMSSQGDFYRYDEIKYHPLGVSIFDSPDKILLGFDNDLNARQKSWQTAVKL